MIRVQIPDKFVTFLGKNNWPWTILTPPPLPNLWKTHGVLLATCAGRTNKETSSTSAEGWWKRLERSWKNQDSTMRQHQRRKPMIDHLTHNTGLQRVTTRWSPGDHQQWSLQVDWCQCKGEWCGWKAHQAGDAEQYSLLFIQDGEGTISVQGNAGKATEAHQEVDQEVQTHTGARHAVVLLR